MAREGGGRKRSGVVHREGLRKGEYLLNMQPIISNFNLKVLFLLQWQNLALLASCARYVTYPCNQKPLKLIFSWSWRDLSNKPGTRTTSWRWVWPGHRSNDIH